MKILDFLLKIKQVVVAILIAFGVAFGVYRAGRREGVVEEKYKQRENAIKKHEEILELKQKVSKLPRDKLNDVLRK
jgi:hypothetical protein